MSFYRQDDCENWKWSKVGKLNPSKPSKEIDVLWVSYSNKPDELDKEKRKDD